MTLFLELDMVGKLCQAVIVILRVFDPFPNIENCFQTMSIFSLSYAGRIESCGVDGRISVHSYVWNFTVCNNKRHLKCWWCRGSLAEKLWEWSSWHLWVSCWNERLLLYLASIFWAMCFILETVCLIWVYYKWSCNFPYRLFEEQKFRVAWLLNVCLNLFILQITCSRVFWRRGIRSNFKQEALVLVEVELTECSVKLDVG